MMQLGPHTPSWPMDAILMHEQLPASSHRVRWDPSPPASSGSREIGPAIPCPLLLPEPPLDALFPLDASIAPPPAPPSSPALSLPRTPEAAQATRGMVIARTNLPARRDL